MLPQFLQKQFFNIAVISLGALVPQTVFSNSPFTPVSSLEVLLEKERSEIEDFKKNYAQNFTELVNNIQNIEDIKIHPKFYESLLFHSEQKYFNEAISKDQCFFTHMYEHNLIKPSGGYSGNVLAVIKYKDKEQVSFMSKDNFFEVLYKKKCFEKKEINSRFEGSNLKNMAQAISLTLPKTTVDCRTLFENWKENQNLPMYCSIYENVEYALTRERVSIRTNKPLSERQKTQLDAAKERMNSFTPTVFSFISNFCNNLNNSEKFCTPYLSNDVWTSIANKEYPSYLIDHTCRLSGKANVLSDNKRELCLNKFKNDKNACATYQAQGFNGLFPHMNCNIVSDLLVKGTLFTDYKDCPGNFDNLSIINVARIVSHKEGLKRETTGLTCINETNDIFANLYKRYDNMRDWPLEICFPNKVTKEKECNKYIPGNNPNDPASEGNIVANILYRNEAALSNLKCSLVDKDHYNPDRLQYASGCFIVYDSNRCSPLFCPKQIYYNKKEISYLEYRGIQTFDYFPSSFSNSKFAITTMMDEVLKIEPKSVKNYTEVKYFFDKNKKGIIHGIGCAEDIHPEYFGRLSFNQCSPLPFIIDGYIEKGNDKWLSLRSTLEDIHFPRRANWGNIFSSVKNYQQHHPLRTWFFYGIK